ncbi:MAG: hypothetical protein ACYC69_00250 [Thermodesulfovibrionales bacterium]
MSKNSTLTPVGESLRSFFSSFVGLAQFDENGQGNKSREEYYPSAELIMKLGETSKEWDVSAFQLFKRDEYFAEIWTDKKTLRQLIVAFRSDKKGIWPVAFEVLDENTELTGVFGGISRELLAKRSKAALRSLDRPVSTSNPLPFEGRKQVA